MTAQLMTSTQVMVVLSINVITQTDNSARLVTLPLVHLTAGLLLLWAIWQGANEVVTLAGEVMTALATSGKVLSIVFNALAFGLGLKL